MLRNAAYELATATRAYLPSPAGYGKTHSIAEAVKLAFEIQGRQLVLTHTHAGVHSLQAKLKKLGVPSSAYNVETIAGWSLKYAAAYRKISKLEIDPAGESWEETYPAALLCLNVPAIRDVLMNSYGGIFVDEYQDCTWAQHELVLALAEIFPCRLLGDPLQGIFDFAGRTVDLDADLVSFERLDELTVPYRWINEGNQELAEWLSQARSDISAGKPLGICRPVAHIPLDRAPLMAYCMRMLERNESVVVAHQVANQSHTFARGSGSRYKSMEEMDCADLSAFARELDGSDGFGKALALLSYARGMIANVSTHLNSMDEAIRKGDFDPARYRSNRLLAQALRSVIDGYGPIALNKSLDIIAGIDGSRTYRRELLRETFRMFHAMDSGKYESYSAAAYEVRERTRRHGRPAEKFSSSRILLIKGLEYQHAVVPNADELGPKELYVAITRGAKTLAIQSSSLTIHPKTERRSLKTTSASVSAESTQGTLFSIPA